MFTITHVDADPIKVGQQLTVEFPYDETTGTIERITVECGCLDPKINSKNKTVSISYVSPGIPKHLAAMQVNSYNTEKKAKVYYQDNLHPALTMEQELTFTVNVSE